MTNRLTEWLDPNRERGFGKKSRGSMPEHGFGLHCSCIEVPLFLFHGCILGQRRIEINTTPWLDTLFSLLKHSLSKI